jgi:hypothetical protein
VTGEVPLLILGVALVVVGGGLVAFASAVQAFALRYEPPGWQRTLWEIEKVRFIGRNQYLWVVRFTGSIIVVIGVALVLSAVRTFGSG